MFGNRDMYGEYVECVQCGHIINLDRPRLDLDVPKGKLKPGRPKKRGSRRTAA
jgi:hypothetical protein